MLTNNILSPICRNKSRKKKSQDQKLVRMFSCLCH